MRSGGAASFVVSCGLCPTLAAILTRMNDGVNADWKSIVKIAVETDAKLGRQCTKPGQRMRAIYGESYRRACQLGYRGSQRDWETFVRVRAHAALE